MKKDECVRHELDEMVDCIRNQSGLEGQCENQRNTIVENHPYLIGDLLLIGLAVTFTVSHLLVFAISFLFLFFIATSLTPLYKGFIQFVFALAINLFLYFESEKVEQAFSRNPDSLMTFLFKFVQMRLRIFYVYFRRVMGGQVIIALINTLISSVVIFGLGLHHPFQMVFVVFFCGLFPVVGNLMSNSVLTINGFAATEMWGTLICVGERPEDAGRLACKT